MSFDQTQQQEIREIVRAIVREELERLRNEVTSLEQRRDKEIDQLADEIFDRYDDVFKALA
jgi:hypothetical protein